MVPNQLRFYKEIIGRIKDGAEYDEIVCLRDMMSKGPINPYELTLIDSLIDQDRYIKRINPAKFNMRIGGLVDSEFSEDYNEIIDSIKRMTDDPAQIRAIERIISLKGIKPQTTTGSAKRTSKLCPHCSRERTESEECQYVICGYSNKGYDWEGCGFDWCFKCGKRLCKCWNLDQLYNKTNRFHDNRCCKIHAERMKHNYLHDYCHCSTIYVRRLRRTN